MVAYLSSALTLISHTQQLHMHVIPHTVKTNVLPQHIIEVQYNGLKIGLFLCAIIAHFFVL